MIDKREIRANTLEITVSGSFKTDHRFVSADGVLGVLSLNLAKIKGTYRGRDDSLLDVKKTSPWKFYYQLEEGSSILGFAQPLKKFSRRIVITFQNQSYELIPDGFIARRWTLRVPGGASICEFQPRGMLKRGAQLRIFTEVELSLLIFAYCLVTRRWQEENSAA